MPLRKEDRRDCYRVLMSGVVHMNSGEGRSNGMLSLMVSSLVNLGSRKLTWVVNIAGSYYAFLLFSMSQSSLGPFKRRDVFLAVSPERRTS